MRGRIAVFRLGFPGPINAPIRDWGDTSCAVPTSTICQVTSRVVHEALPNLAVLGRKAPPNPLFCSDSGCSQNTGTCGTRSQ